MSRRVVITGLGPVSGLGLGMEAFWSGLVAGRSAISRIESFDPGGFPCQIASEVPAFKVRDYVPKSYRKAIKVMASDIEYAVAAADLAARDAGLVTAGTDPGQETTYDSARVGCHIGAGLIATEINELTSALAEARDDQGQFDIHKWGESGMGHLTPLWLLKYLPNMLACHVTIVHDCQGPSNTITCAEASAGLSIGESLRVIQRGAADACFCGGAEDKLNPMAYLRQIFTNRLNTESNDNPDNAVRAFDENANGMIAGQGGAITFLESVDTFNERKATANSDAATPKAYAEVAGFGASQTLHQSTRNHEPDPEGKGIALAIKKALADANLTADEVDLIVPFGIGVPAYDKAEAAALQSVFGTRVKEIPLVSTKPFVGNCFSGAGGLDACVAANAIYTQHIPARINCDNPIADLNVTNAPAQDAKVSVALTYGASLGGQNAALVLKRFEEA